MEEKKWTMPTHIVAAAGVVENEQGEVLLVKTYNGGWVFPGGQVEVGENIIDGVKREILEESGIEAEVRAFLHFFQHVQISGIWRYKGSTDESNAGFCMQKNRRRNQRLGGKFRICMDP